MKMFHKQLWLITIPILGFLLFWILRSWNSDLKGFDFASGWVIVKNYLPLLGLCWLLFQFGKSLAHRTLMIFSLTIVVLLAISIFTHGKLPMWCVVGRGIIHLHRFSVHFLAGAGWHRHLQKPGFITAGHGNSRWRDFAGSSWSHCGCLEHSNRVIVPLIAYAYVAFYGWKGHRIGAADGIAGGLKNLWPASTMIRGWS
ncbi:MAG: hypothetical protein WDM76_04485 [Limisphaerales bacterium]